MTFRKLRLLMSKYGFSILFMGFELWASFAAFFWLKVAIFNPVAEAYEYYFLGDLSVLSVIFLVNPSIICYNCD